MTQMLNHICQDLLVLILKSLPIKSLLRFRSVCKSWKQLIASKAFILHHLVIQKPYLIAEGHESIQLFLLANQLPNILSTKTLAFPPEFPRLTAQLRVVSSVHGVICLYDRTDRIILWNPSIRRFLVTPQCCFRFLFRVTDFGFWIDPSTNEFKVFSFRLYAGYRKAKLFSSRKQAWEEFPMGDIGRGYCSLPEPCSLQDGVAHWMTFCRNSQGSSITTHVIVFFDFGKDKLGTIELPEQVRRTHINGLSLCKWQDFVSILKYRGDPPQECDLWAMQNGSWSKMFSFNLIKGFRNVLCVLDEGRGMVLGTAKGFDNIMQLRLYDHSNGSCYCIPLQANGVESQRLFYVDYDVVESLVFPSGDCVSSY